VLRLAVEQQLALIGGDDAGQDLHERRLTGPVLADERVHAGRLDRERDLGDGPDAAVVLRDGEELDEGRRGAHRV
jgi:hypothetical protein